MVLMMLIWMVTSTRVIAAGLLLVRRCRLGDLATVNIFLYSDCMGVCVSAFLSRGGSVDFDIF